MKTTLGIIVLALVAYFGGFNYGNVETIKANAAQTWAKAGFKIVGYEGYQIGKPFEAPGGRVWYVVEKIGDSRVRYSGFLSKWGDEFHVYNLKAIDAIAAN